MKFLAPLTNVRPSKTDVPELSTAPSSGMLKLNTPGANLLGVTVKDYVTIVPAEKENGDEGFFITKGQAGSTIVDEATGKKVKTSQVGAILSSASGTGTGTLQFGSENAWQTLGGNDVVKKIYTISEEPVEQDGVQYFELVFSRDEAKAVRVKKDKQA